MNTEHNKTDDSSNDKIDRVRSTLWYYFIEGRLNANNPYRVERLMDNNALYRNEYGEVSNKNKWRRYKKGITNPNKSLILNTEKKLPGSRQIFDHILWSVLQIEKPANLESCLKQLNPDIQKLIFKNGSFDIRNECRRPPLTSKKITAIEKRANFDALACITILLMQATETEEHELILSLARSVFRVLLILCTSHPWHFCLLDLFSIYKEKVFGAIKSEKYKIVFDDYDFYNSVEILKQSLFYIEDNLLFDPEKCDANQIMLDILYGHYGFKIASTFNLPVVFV